MRDDPAAEERSLLHAVPKAHLLRYRMIKGYSFARHCILSRRTVHLITEMFDSVESETSGGLYSRALLHMNNALIFIYNLPQVVFGGLHTHKKLEHCVAPRVAYADIRT
jgi:hypothetical protein